MLGEVVEVDELSYPFQTDVICMVGKWWGRVVKRRSGVAEYERPKNEGHLGIYQC